MNESTRLKHCFATWLALILSLQNKTMLKGEPILDSVNENRLSCAAPFKAAYKKKAAKNILKNNS